MSDTRSDTRSASRWVEWRETWRDAFRMDKPVPPSPASRRLRALIAVTAATVVVVEALNLQSVDAPGFSLFVRTVWALLRVLGFLILMRAVRFGRAAARPFGLILAVTTVFAVARLAQPRQGALVPPSAVLAFAILSIRASTLVVIVVIVVVVVIILPAVLVKVP